MGLRFASGANKGFKITTEVPSPNRSVEKIFEDQRAEYEAKRGRQKVKAEGIRIELEDAGPYALMFTGDPHAGDDGCDLGHLASDLQIIKDTPHMFGANMGDLTNNWIRALGHLYAKQHTTDGEELALMRWLIGAADWLFVILGNHDKWGPLAAAVCENAGVMAVDHGSMFRIVSGDSELLVDARHTHKGHSMYNPGHAQLKKNYRGSQADIIIGAHTHTSAYTQIKNGITGKIGHAIRVGAYKKVDEYADQHDFEDGAISPSVVAVIDPSADEVGKVTIFHNPHHAVTFLRALREAWEMEEAA